jgi:O-antigen/teichoic acid export membrane protein
VFGALAYLGLAGRTAVDALGKSAAPRLAKYYALGNQGAYFGLLLKLAAIGAALGAVGVAITYFAGPFILTAAYGPEYARHNSILVWTMIAAGITYVAALTGYGITAARYFRVQIPLYALVATAGAAACWWLVPQMGLIGAAWALCIAALTQLVGGAIVVLYAMRANRAVGTVQGAD